MVDAYNLKLFQFYGSWSLEAYFFLLKCILPILGSQLMGHHKLLESKIACESWHTRNYKAETLWKIKWKNQKPFRNSKKNILLVFTQIACKNGEWKQEASCFGWLQLPQHPTWVKWMHKRCFGHERRAC